MKNHVWVDGQLRQTNKQFSALKQKQKEQINQWLNRRANAQLVEKAFYGGQGAESVESEQGADTQVADQAQAAGMDIQQLMKILSNPEMVNMLKMLSKTMG